MLPNALESALPVAAAPLEALAATEPDRIALSTIVWHRPDAGIRTRMETANSRRIGALPGRIVDRNAVCVSEGKTLSAPPGVPAA